MSSEWLEGHELAEKYTTEDFVGLFGYEMTWSNGLGHMNTFNTPGFQSRTQGEYTNFGTALQNYYETLQNYHLLNCSSTLRYAPYNSMIYV